MILSGLSLAPAGLIADATMNMASEAWPSSSSSPMLIYVALALLAIPAIWLLWRRRAPGLSGANRLLRIQESCMVGPRQFVVVAAYGEARVMFGVSPGRIDYLCRFDERSSAATSERESTQGDSIFSKLVDKEPRHEG